MQKPMLNLAVGVITIILSAAAIGGFDAYITTSKLSDVPVLLEKLEAKITKIEISIATLENDVQWFKSRAERQDAND